MVTKRAHCKKKFYIRLQCNESNSISESIQNQFVLIKFRVHLTNNYDIQATRDYFACNLVVCTIWIFHIDTRLRVFSVVVAGELKSAQRKELASLTITFRTELVFCGM